MHQEALLPNLVILGALLLITTVAPNRPNIARSAFVAIVIAAMVRYLWWRWHDTLPGDWSTPQGFYIVICFGFELVVSAERILGLIVLSRTSDRQREADDAEAWARNQPLNALPSVDVLIPTYNEERDVLERTIVGACSLDYPNFTVWVLDDGRRDWVAELAATKGARYLTRDGNRHAKAGNINAALRRTRGELLLVLDADFVPRTHTLWRLVGFFRDPRIACVQTPQYFFNKDPTQTNLGLADRWADDQRFFFDVIMPSRDAWGAAFCCGTGFVVRRSAIEAIGGGIPTESICEDMLTSIEFKRRGLETIYLKEELCIGLAPESVKAFFVQRQRWARGQIQILFLRRGIFGAGLPFLYRLLMLPGYWVLQLPARIVYVLVPVVFLLSGLAPLIARDLGLLLGYLGPTLIGSVGLMCWIAGRSYFPLLTDANGLFLSLRVTPAAFSSLIKPFGKPFAVTPKGAAARGQNIDRLIFYICLGLIGATIIGLAENAFNDWRIIEDRSTLAFAAFWAVINCIIVGLAAMIAREAPRYRAHERFAVSLSARCVIGTEPSPCRITNISLGGLFAHFGNYPVPASGSTVRLSIPGIGNITGAVARTKGDGAGIQFTTVTTTTAEAIQALREVSAHSGGRQSGRKALRVQLDARARIISGDKWQDCLISDASLSGAMVLLQGPSTATIGDYLTVEVPEVGLVSARVARETSDGLGLAFEDVDDELKDALIRLLYTVPRQVTIDSALHARTLVPVLFKRLFGPDHVVSHRGGVI
jgi:cellulose synthase/poly-beta-1,6-N-acetylglucosamine synthase-like glycosyltransferase